MPAIAAMPAQSGVILETDLFRVSFLRGPNEYTVSVKVQHPIGGRRLMPLLHCSAEDPRLARFLQQMGQVSEALTEGRPVFDEPEEMEPWYADVYPPREF